MRQIAAIVRKHPRLLVISDEVYKYTVYAGEGHFHFAALPGMFERTVTLSSAGKTFSITGWQAGWCVGPATLLKPIQLMLPFVQGPEANRSTGMGLAVCKRIVELHGGQIEIDFEPGQSFCVRLSLPVEDCRAHSATEAAA